MQAIENITASNSAMTAALVSSLECSIYVASLSDYNAGIHHGQWIDCLDDSDSVQDQIAAMLAESPTAREEGRRAEEWAIHDHGGFYGLGIGESADIEELCALAVAIEEHGQPFAAYWDYSASGVSVENAVERFQDAFEGVYDSMTDYAEDYAESAGLLDSMPENLRYYFDYERFGRDMEINGDVFAVRVEGGGLAVFLNY